MTVRINTNAMALNTHRNVVNNSKAQAKNLEKLSSGLKINRAADAPAALGQARRCQDQRDRLGRRGEPQRARSGQYDAIWQTARRAM